MRRLLTIFVLALIACTALTSHVSAQTAAASALLNANTATEAQIAALPHLNATSAKTIVGKRPFKTFVDLDGVLKPVLSDMQRAELYGRLFVPVNINSATDAEILLIPGTGPRMLREFKEYRPYDAIEKFRREIGKYVSKEEVARFERYIVLK